MFGELSLFDTDLMEQIAALRTNQERKEMQMYRQLKAIGMLAGTLIDKIKPFVHDDSMTVEKLKETLTAETMEMIDFPGGASLLDYIGKIYQNEGSGRTGKFFGIERIFTGVRLQGSVSMPWRVGGHIQTMSANEPLSVI